MQFALLAVLIAVLAQRSLAAQALPLIYANTRATRADTTQPGWQFETGGPFPLSRLRGLLPGEDNLVDLRVLSRTGLENVFFYGTILGYSREYMQERLDTILAFADIGEFIHQPIKTYSSGMRARLAFAVATA